MQSLSCPLKLRGSPAGHNLPRKNPPLPHPRAPATGPNQLPPVLPDIPRVIPGPPAVVASEATSSTSPLVLSILSSPNLWHNSRQAHSPCLGPREHSSRAAAARWLPAPFTLLRGGWLTLRRCPRGNRWELSGEGECRGSTVPNWLMDESLTIHVVSRLFGFLFGCVLSGGAVYSYVLGEYKASNDLLTEDIYVRLPELCGVYTNTPFASKTPSHSLRGLYRPEEPLPKESLLTNIPDSPSLRFPPEQLRQGSRGQDAGEKMRAIRATL